MNDDAQPKMTAAILCGGRSSRYGQPKEWLDFGGRPLLEHVARVVTPLFDRVLAVGLRPGAPALPRLVEPVEDAVPGAGPLGGIVSALRASETEYTFMFACDTPFIRPALVRALQAMAQGADAVVPASGPHYQPLFSIYSKSCLPIAEKHLFEGMLKISDMFPKLAMRIISEHEQRRHDPGLISFFNINTAADYERATAMARGASAVTAAD